MNTVLKCCTNRIVLMLISGGVLSGIIACSSKDKEFVVPEEDNTITGTFLSIKIPGIEEKGSDVSLSRASISNSAQTSSSSLLAPSRIISTENFDAVVSAQEQQISHNTQKSASGLTAASPTLDPVNTTPMVAGKKYRLLIYDAATNTLEKSVDATAGSSTEIPVSAGKQYTWYAVSTNDNTTPVVNVSGVVTASFLANKDVLWNQGNITTVSGKNDLNIIFKRNTARIEVELDTRGMFGIIENSTSLEVGTGTGSSFESIIETGDLNVFTGQYLNTQDVAAVRGTGMINKDGVQGAVGATKIAYFYTINTSKIPTNNLRVRLNQLDIHLDDNSSREFTNSIIPYNNFETTPTLGNRYTLNVRLIESGVRLNGLLWARSNLIYNSSITDKYRFQPNNDYSQPGRDIEYWNWMAATPTGSSSDNIDPCSKVYPESTWRMPSSVELNALGQPDDRQENYGLFLGANFSAIYNLDQGYNENPSYPKNSQKLFLSFYGYRTSPGILGGTSITDSPGGLFLGAIGGGSANYWSSTPVNNNNANYWYMNYSRFAWFVGWSSASIRSGGKTQGRMVRCVRSTSVANT